MKKILSIVCMALVSVAMMAQEPVITFEKTEHDFGKIAEDGGRVSTEFVFKNEGMAPLVLSNVRASCGCTTPTWTKEPVEPGKTGSITVTYNPNGRPGKFSKTITITSNATEPGKRVFIKGEVIPKQAKPVNKYTIAVGELNMKMKELNLGDIKKGEVKSGELEYANQKEAEHKVELATADSWLINQVTLEAPKPHEVGKFVFAIDTKTAPLYGPVEVYAYVVVDGKLVKTDEFKLTIKANIVEDFSNLTLEQKQNAPIIEVPAEFNAGKFVKGKIYKYTFPVKNAGSNPLEIRRAYCADTRLDAKAPKAVKSGKKGAISVLIDTRELDPAAFTREMVIITNDYQNPIKRVKINFTVE
ncbi:MAG: DUF1573 domain-containing protein [Paludibacteraceae bacterium]|nr:DUF1573 domain-containing protein [Paludibacteraceae bacterium]MBR4706412.1 DUF1573 domain-containing protein [Paludibacteraceae bacterium]